MSDSRLKPIKTKKILGSGNNKKPSQSFTLDNVPTTVALEVYVDNVLWEQVDSLKQCRPMDKAYVVRIDEAGRSSIQFGDGIHGAIPPTGRNNVVAAYRAGGGKAGNVGSVKKSRIKKKRKVKK